MRLALALAALLALTACNRTRTVAFYYDPITGRSGIEYSSTPDPKEQI
jgi:hypothetical protein